MNRSYDRRVAGFLSLGLVIIATPGACTGAEKTRDALKTYFETGDVPTQEQFKSLIDSTLNLVDDGLAAYTLRDSVGRAPRLDAGTIIGPDLQFFPLADVQGFSAGWGGHSGFLPLAFTQDSQLHYAYLQISSPVPGAPNLNSMTVEYLVYQDLADTALTTQTVPEPSTMCLALAALVGLLAYRRRRWK